MILADIWSCITALSTDKWQRRDFFHLSMEINESPVVFQDVLSKYKTARDFTEACAHCLIPLAPSNRSLLLCEECEGKWREEKRPIHDFDDQETPLSSANISFALDDAGDTENCASGQLDKENDLEKFFLHVEKELAREDLSHGMSNTNESLSRNRIIEIVKRVLKTCGYVAAAVIGAPLFAGKLILCLRFHFPSILDFR